MTEFVMNQAGRDQLRDALIGCLNTNLDPEKYADACADQLENVTVINGEPEAGFEVPAAHNIHGVPFTIDISGAAFFNIEEIDE